MAHPYSGHKSLHTDRLSKMLGGMKREAGAKATHSEQLNAAKGASGRMAMHGEKAKSAKKYARGGRTKGKTNININVMPAAPEAAPAMPPTLPAGMGAVPAPKPPMPPPPGPMAGGMPPGLLPGMPPGAGPMMPHKSGGRAYKKGGAVSAASIAANAVHKHEKHLHKGEKETKFKRGGGIKDGPTWKEGLRNGTKVQHAGQNDAKDINRPPVITKKHGGRLTSEHVKMKNIKNAAGGGLGRLEKIRMYGK